jgi:very-short-patch-repair endonuclease
MARYSSLQNDHARKLREMQTDVEIKLWRHLRRRQLNGAKFRRQHPVGPFITDFCCVEHRLVVELDGGQHTEQSNADQQRTNFLNDHGFRVLRFWNNEVIENLEGVLARISEAMEFPHPNPIPLRGRGNKKKPKEVRV